MKSFSDIFSQKSKKLQDIDLRVIQKECIVSDDTNPIFYDIEKQNPKDILLGKTQKILVEKKMPRWKNFDALERHGDIIKLFRRDIRIKNTYFSRSKKVYTFFAQLINNFFLSFLSLFSYIFQIKKSLTLLSGFGLLVIFFCSIILLGLVSKNIIEQKTRSGYETLISLKDGGRDFGEVRTELNNLRFDFFVARALFLPFSLFSGETLSSTKYLIYGASDITSGLDLAFTIFSEIQKYLIGKELGDIYWTHIFIRLQDRFKELEGYVSSAYNDYEKISWLPSTDLMKQKDRVTTILGEAGEKLIFFNANFDVFLDILGREKRKQYLIVFQNADEIRPTGGFMGSMALMSMYRGKVDIFQKKDVYAIEWDLKSASYNRLSAPKGLSELTPIFGLRDANYFVNLDDSGKAIDFFLKQAGIEIDGIIFLNQNILLDLLDITGPIFFDPLKREIGSHNFSEVMSLAVESKIFKKGTLGTPKEILFEFMKAYYQKLQSDGKYFEYVQLLLREIKSRDIMIWMQNDTHKRFLEGLGLSQKLHKKNEIDFGYPVYTSLSGNKSDRYMQRSYQHRVNTLKDTSCDFLIQDEIRSTHAMTKVYRDQIILLMQEYGIENTKEAEFIQGAGRNRQFVRYLLPSGAKDIIAENASIVDYGERKGLEFFLDTPLLQTSLYKFSYRLPNPSCLPYSYMFYKQPGIRSYELDIIYDDEVIRFSDLKSDYYFSR